MKKNIITVLNFLRATKAWALECGFTNIAVSATEALSAFEDMLEELGFEVISDE